MRCGVLRPRRTIGGYQAIATGIAVSMLLSGCAESRSARFGFLPNAQPLVTLLVSRNGAVVERECPKVAFPGRVVGCHVTSSVTLPDGSSVRAVKIVRYTDALPSKLAFEIDIHELCHAVAALQHIEDPCHGGNAGVISSARPGGDTLRAR